MKYIFVFLISLTLVHAIIDVSEHLLQPLGHVKHPAPSEMRQLYCHPYYVNRMENITDVIKNITEVVEQTRDITSVLCSLSKAIISMTELLFTMNLGVVVVVGMLFLK